MTEPDAKNPASTADLMDDLVLANHILADQGILDAFGHVSVRAIDGDACFLLSENMAPGDVTAADILAFDEESEPLDARGRAVYLERFIHGEIYRKRPDVSAIVHSHSDSIVPLSVVAGIRMPAVCHTAAFIGEAAPLFEIRDVAGDATDLLISTNALGSALASTMGDDDIVLMRGHGSTVAAASLEIAVFRAYYAEMNARYLMQAMALGRYTALTAGEVATCVKNIEPQAKRPWNLWAARARAKRS